jgi:hypothetical protein
MTKFFKDLYQDLDDRHLLLPAIALLVCLVAAPFLLSDPSTPPSSVTVTPAAGEAQGTATESAVLTTNPGVRDYRKRLERFKSKNPFASHFAVPNPASGPGLTVSGPAGAASGTTGATGSTSLGVAGSTSTSTGSTTTTPTSTATSSSGGTSSGATTTTTSSNTPEQKSHRVNRFFTYRVDVKVGEPGHLDERKGVEKLEALPGKSRPVFIFLGASEDGKRALFAISDQAGKPAGDGTCVPGKTDCQYLVLKAGEAESVEYAPDATRYKLKLLSLNRVLVHTGKH